MATNMSNVKFKVIILFLIMLILIIPKNELAKENEDIVLEKIILGDVNNDKTIDYIDLLWILKHIYSCENSKHPEWLLKDYSFLAGDITKNGEINYSDVIAILRYLAANENEDIAKEHQNWLNLGEVEINIDTISLNKSQIDIFKGSSEQLIATVLPTYATHKTIEWSSSNEQVATVDQTGKITAKNEGTTTITVRTSNGKIATCIVTVRPVEIYATSINLDKNSLELEEGKEEIITASIKPINTTNKTVIWTSSDKQVAIVDQNGKITAKNEGTTTITARTSNGKVATCFVIIKPKEISITSIKLNKDLLKIVAGKEEELIATIEPSNATNKTIAWTSSNEQIATVDQNGKVTALSDGETTITATTSNGKIAECVVKVGLLKGIDVSTFQGDIDWDKVAQTQDFAIIRVGFRRTNGTMKIDNKFIQNIQGANNAGIKVGVYFYSTAINEIEAEEEANFVLEAIKGYNISYPVIIDQEYDERLSSLTKDQRADIAIKFLDIIEEKGYIPMYYGEQTLINMSRMDKYDFWLASYTYNPNKPSSYSGEYTIWQYSDKGVVDGIDGDVDMNIGYKDY